MNKRQIKKKRKNEDMWLEVSVYGYREARLLERAYHEYCISTRKSREIKMQGLFDF